MVNTAFTVTTATIPITDLFTDETRRAYYLLLFTEAHLRPPVFDEMYADAERLIASQAQRYCDQTCQFLHHDELVAEGRRKLAQLVDKGELNRQTNRVNFFKFFKTSLANHFCSLVQKYRFTHKRTGQQPPPRKRFDVAAPVDCEEEQPQTYKKQVEISLDDEETHLQVADSSESPDGTSELLEEWMSILNPLERLVLKELTEPSATALCYATLDAHLGRKPGNIRVDIKHEHMAQASGISAELFEKTVLSVRAKITAHRSMSTAQQAQATRRSAIIQQLSQIYQVQIPPNLDDMVMRRLFTIAARDQIHLYNPEIGELLTEIGAKPPVFNTDKTLACFGVLFKSNDRRCINCGYNKACSVESANIGLGKITLSTKLLGTRGTRYPVILPTQEPVTVALNRTADAKELDIVAYLDENYLRQERDGQVFYVHKPHGSLMTPHRRPLFCLERVNPISLRFCSPTANVKQKLIGKPKAWYPPDDIDNDELLQLIDEHSSEIYQLEERHG